MQSSRPLLVIVSGAPASGKSSLAQRLAGDLRLPLLGKDACKELLADALGPPPDVAASMQLGRAAYAILYHVAARLLDAGCGVIIESNFRRGLSEGEILPLLKDAAGVQVHCSAPATVLEQRYAERAAAGARHAAHLDADRAMDLTADLTAGRFQALELGVPVVGAELDGDWRPSYPQIREAVARARGAP